MLSDKKLVIITAAGMMILFIVDLFIPLGVAVGVLYLLVLFFLLSVKESKFIYYGALAASIFTLAGWIVMLEYGSNWMVAVNRVISLLAIWATAFLIVEYKRRQARILKNLHESKQQYTNMIAEVQDYAIVLLDTAGTIQNWNLGAEKIKGYQAEEVIGRHISMFYTDEDQGSNRPERLIQTAIQKGRANDECWRVRKDGTLIWANVTITAIHGADGGILGFSKVTRDLTEKKRAEDIILKKVEELKFKNKELSQFAYVASHDLQEPLRTITSYVQLLMESDTGKKDELESRYLTHVSDASKRMSSLIKDLLDYSRIGRSRQKEEVDCNELLSMIISDLQYSIDSNLATINVSELPSITAFKAELWQLFQNLLSNALKFTDKSRKLEVSIYGEEREKEWQFTVEDNGIGILEQHFERIFIIFQRLHVRELYPGTGIGLALCKKIVEIHEGKIWVESQIEEGSKFHFTIAKPEFVLPVLDENKYNNEMVPFIP